MSPANCPSGGLKVFVVIPVARDILYIVDGLKT